MYDIVLNVVHITLCIVRHHTQLMWGHLVFTKVSLEKRFSFTPSYLATEYA